MTPLIYSLHSGNLYGTERMALATAEGLRDEFETTFIAPAGPVHDELRRRGFRGIVFKNKFRYFLDVRRLCASHARVAAIGTRVVHTLAFDLWARLYGRRCANIQVVHGGTDERLSYGSKKWLDCLGVKQVAVSKFVRERMLAHGVNAGSVTVIENFLSPELAGSLPRRTVRQFEGVQKVVIVSRLDPIKRIDLLLDALDLEPSLRRLQFDIYGTGSDEQRLRSRARANYPQVNFRGFCPDVASRIAEADLLLHLCPEEPFGLAILEAMAAAVPAMVPNSGGAGDIVTPGRTGFHFHANDARSLAHNLRAVIHPPAGLMHRIATAAFHAGKTRFSAERGVAGYRGLIQTCLN